MICKCGNKMILTMFEKNTDNYNDDSFVFFCKACNNIENKKRMGLNLNKTKKIIFNKNDIQL